MTPARVNRIIHKWQDALGLGDWQVKFCPIPSAEDEHGAITFDVTHAMAYIQLEEGIPDAAVEPVVVHEMLHLLLGEMNACARTGFNQVGSEAQQILLGQHDVAEHRVITRLMAHLGFPAAEWRVPEWAAAFPL